MLTIQQINDAHDRLGNAATLAEYVRTLNSIGVEAYTSYVSDAHSEYFGRDSYTITPPPVHERFTISDASNREQFLEHLHLHDQQKTTYMEMSKGLAESGIEKWTVDTYKRTITFYDKAGNALLIEAIG